LDGAAMRGLTKLLLMVTVTWVLVLGETFFFFVVIRPLGPNVHESASSAVLKVTSTILLLLLWIVVMFLLRRYYVRSAPVQAEGVPVRA